MAYPPLSLLDTLAFGVENSLGLKSFIPTLHVTKVPIVDSTSGITFEEIPSLLRSSAARRLASLVGPLVPPDHCDERLNNLEINHWVKVPVDDMFATSAISIYIKHDHPTPGFFDADVVLEDPVHHRLEFCLSLFINYLLFLAYVCHISLISTRTTLLVEYEAIVS
jgi:hypothetical protein